MAKTIQLNSWAKSVVGVVEPASEQVAGGPNASEGRAYAEAGKLFVSGKIRIEVVRMVYLFVKCHIFVVVAERAKLGSRAFTRSPGPCIQRVHVAVPAPDENGSIDYRRRRSYLTASFETPQLLATTRRRSSDGNKNSGRIHLFYDSRCIFQPSKRHGRQLLTAVSMKGAGSLREARRRK